MTNNLGPIRRILKLEPGISLGWWLYERINSNWDRLLALFIGAGGMAYLASITDWMVAWGPIGIGATGIGFALVIWLALSVGTGIRARAYERRVRADMQAQWFRAADRVNLAAKEFREQRINLADLVVPGDLKIIRNKTFFACEIVGPTNIIFWRENNLGGSNRFACDAVVIQRDDSQQRIWTGIWVENCQFINCTFYNVTFFFGVDQYPHFARFGFNWISMLPDKDTPTLRNSNDTVAVGEVRSGS